MSLMQRPPKAEWHVLLVDDDDDYALIIERALKAAAGVPVIIRRARTGSEALSVARGERSAAITSGSTPAAAPRRSRRATAS